MTLSQKIEAAKAQLAEYEAELARPEASRYPRLALCGAGKRLVLSPGGPMFIQAMRDESYFDAKLRDGTYTELFHHADVPEAPPLASVESHCGRTALYVAGIAVVAETQDCFEASVPYELVRINSYGAGWWTLKSLQWAADKINAAFAAKVLGGGA